MENLLFARNVWLCLSCIHLKVRKKKRAGVRWWQNTFTTFKYFYNIYIYITFYIKYFLFLFLTAVFFLSPCNVKYFSEHIYEVLYIYYINPDHQIRNLNHLCLAKKMIQTNDLKTVIIPLGIPEKKKSLALHHLKLNPSPPTCDYWQVVVKNYNEKKTTIFLTLTNTSIEKEPISPSHSVLYLLQFFEIDLQLLLAPYSSSGGQFNPLKVHVHLWFPFWCWWRSPLAATTTSKSPNYIPNALSNHKSNNPPPVVSILFI